MTGERALVLAGLAALTLSGAVAGAFELFLVPLYSDTVLVPVAVLLAVAGNIALPRLARALAPGGRAAMLPFVGWLIPVIVLALFTRPEGDVVLPADPHAVEWTGYGVLLAGLATGIVTVVALLPPPGQPVKG